MHISELVFRKKKIFYFLVLAVVIGGVFSFQKLSKLEDPEITIMVANVVTVYPGASAHDVEMKVTNVLEEEFSALADINKIQSRSEANVSIVTVELEMTVPQKEIPQRWEFLRRRIETTMPKLPSGVQTPMVFDDIGDVYGMFYAMTADEGFSYEEMSNYADFIKRNMLKVEGVKKVYIYGEQSPEISITLSADKMSEMGIMPLQIFAAISDHTKELYAGNIFSGRNQLRVNVNQKSASAEDLSNILISSLSGTSFKLGDIANIEEGYQTPVRNTLNVNNQKALGIALSMESGENIIEVGKRVEEELEKLKIQIPSGISFEKVFFQPEKVKDSIHGFMLNLILSVVIVIIVLMFTMGFKGGFIIGSGLILTILATFPILLTAGGTLQRISLGAFIVAMGMLVDNAIVVLDGILIEKNKGKYSKKAFTKTAKQTAIPLLGATLIAIAAFFPVYLSPDTAGTYVRDLFLVLAISLAFSWILALTQVPLFAAMFYKNKNAKTKSSKEKTDLTDKSLFRFAKKALELSMHHRIITILIAFVLLAIAGLNFRKVDKTFFPDFNYNQFYIEYTLPRGSTPEMVNEHLSKITDHFNSFDEVEMVVTSHGMTPMRYCLVRGMMTENADNYGELIVNFKDYETMQKMRPKFADYLHQTFPEARSRIRKYTLSVKSTHAVEAEFTGPDPAVLKRLSHEVETFMLANEHANKYTICNDWEPKTASLNAIYDPIAGNRTAITRNDVSNAILAATDGLPIATIYKSESSYPVRFKLRDKDGNRITDLNDIPVWGSMPNLNSALDMDKLMGIFTGVVNIDDLMSEIISAVPLSSVSSGVKLDWEEPVVRRLNGKRVIQAQCDPMEGISPAQLQNELNTDVEKMKIPEGYSYTWVGESELKTDGLKGILSFLPLAASIILLILLFLFNDYRRPLIILLCLPMTVIGIVPGLLLSNQPFSFIAIVGVIGLTGMIIKNAIVLLDEISVRMYHGIHPYEAVITATVSRIRPVTMASLTTILGMIPLLSDPMYASMAVAIIGGLLVGTLITLIFVPVLYSFFFGVKTKQVPSIEASRLNRNKRRKMKHLKYRLFVLLIAFGGLANGQEKQILTLSQCRSMAIKNSEALKIAEENLHKAQGEKSAAKSALFPNIAASAIGMYNQIDIQEELYLPTQNFNPATGELEPNLLMDPSTGQAVIGPDGNPIFNSYAYLPLDITIHGGFLAGVSAEQAIYAGGKIQTGNKMAGIGEKMAKSNLQLQESQLKYHTDQAFYTYLATREKVALAKKYNQLLLHLVEVVGNSYNSGMINRNELLKVQVHQNETALSVQKAESGLQLSKMALCQLIGIDLNTQIEIQDSLGSISMLPNTLSALNAKERIEHQLLEHQLELAKQNIKMTRGDYLPTAGVSAGYNYYNINLKDADNYSSNGFNITGSLKIPITTFGERKGKLAVAKANYNIRLLELQQSTKLMQLEMEQANLNLLDAHTRIQLTNKALEQATENQRLCENNYELGMETLTNLLEAQAEWQKAYSNKIDALTNYKMKESRFLQLTRPTDY